MRKSILLVSALLLTAFNGLSAQGFSPSIPAEGDDQSPTSLVTQELFEAPADQYLHVLKFNDFSDPVFFFQYEPSAINGSSTRPLEVGLGAWWLPTLYGAGNYQYNAFIEGQIGGQSLVQTGNTVIQQDGSGNTVGTRTTETTQFRFQDYSYHHPTFLVGFKLGDMLIGARSSTAFISSYERGNYSTSGGFGTSTLVVDKDASGAVIRQAATGGNVVYGKDGYIGGNYFRQQLIAGASLPLGPLTAKASAGLEFLTGNNNDSFASQETVIAEPLTAFPSFSGFGDLGSLTGVRSYTYDEEKIANGFFDLAVPLYGEAVYGFQLFGAKASAVAGLGYRPVIGFNSATLKDENGADVSVGGGESSRSYSRTVDFVTNATYPDGVYQVSTSDTNTIVKRTYTGDFSQNLSIPLSLTVTPSETVRFAFSLTPSVSTSSTTYTVQSLSKTVSTFDDGDAVGASTDPDDTQSLNTVTGVVAEKTNEGFTVSADFTAGVQFDILPKFLRLNLGTKVYNNFVDRYTNKVSFSGLQTSVTQSTVAGVTTTTASTVATNPTDPESGSANDQSNNVYDYASDTWLASELGLTIFLNPNMTLDLRATSSDVLNLTSTQGTGSGSGFFDLNNYSIQLTIKLPPAGAAAN